ncbi:MAG: hypothetical protein FGF53_11120 [Candidatus Brockarchaeota archaeon]|nr:hypothetical protein [Candidatus Brockarchaeota archaeon]MBO3809508.1 hypothetical protein [Candidatus Brockarchaeota archaeon]
MTEYYLGVMWMEGSPEEIVKSEYQKELEKAEDEIRKKMGVSPTMVNFEFKFMLHKGIKYIPAIVYTAFKLRRSYESFEEWGMSLTREQNRMLVGAYMRLRMRVKGARTLRRGEYLRPKEEGWCELYTTRVAWPPETLDLKEVQEEIKRLTEGGDLLSKDDPEDREFTRRHLMENESDYYKEKGEALTDIRIEYVNLKSRAWGEYLKAIHDVHHKYPDIKFYLHVYYF